MCSIATVQLEVICKTVQVNTSYWKVQTSHLQVSACHLQVDASQFKSVQIGASQYAQPLNTECLFSLFIFNCVFEWIPMFQVTVQLPSSSSFLFAPSQANNQSWNFYSFYGQWSWKNQQDRLMCGQHRYFMMSWTCSYSTAK